MRTGQAFRASQRRAAGLSPRKAVAMRGPFPCPGHRTLEQVWAEEAWGEPGEGKGERIIAHEPIASGRIDAAETGESAALLRDIAAPAGAVKVRPEIDWKRVAEARRATVHAPPPPPAPRALKPAESPEECRRCGIPGRKGCAHQLPYDAEPVDPATRGNPQVNKKRNFDHGGR